MEFQRMRLAQDIHVNCVGTQSAVHRQAQQPYPRCNNYLQNVIKT